MELVLLSIVLYLCHHYISTHNEIQTPSDAVHIASFYAIKML